MYLWKAWNDHRGRIAIYVAACAALGIIVGVESLAGYHSSKAWYAMYLERLQNMVASPVFHRHFRLWTPEHELWAWWSAGYALQFYLSWLPVWVGLLFGATTMGRHLTPGSADFLLSRPEPRWRAVWSEWGLTIPGLMAVMVAPVALVALFLLRMDGSLHEPRIFILSLAAFLVAATIFGLTQFMTTLTSSALKGLNFSIAAILIYGLLPTALHEWWHWYAPLRLQDWTFLIFDWYQWGRVEAAIPPTGPFIYWAALALTFPVLTQLVLRRREL